MPPIRLRHLPTACGGKGSDELLRGAKELQRRFRVLRFRAQQREVRERREAGGFAQGDLRFGEGVVAAADQGLQQRMFRMMRLQQHRSDAFGAARAAGDLHQQLREFFAGAEIGGEQAFVDADHADQREVRQVVAFRQHLRADEDAGARSEFGEMLLQRVAAAGVAAVDAQHRHVGEFFRQQFLDALGARTLWLQREAGAIRTRHRCGGTRAAVVALQAAAVRVHGHRSVAAPALRAPAAIVAEQGGRVAAAVLEHEHLPAGIERGADRVQHLVRQPGLQRTFAHVEHAHRRRLRFARALVQAQVFESPAARVVQRFQRGRGAAEHDRHAELARTHQGEIAGVVADAVLLLVAGVVLLVDDDQARVRQWREHRRTRADDDARFATPGRGPGLGALVVVESRVHRMHRHAEARAETREQLRGQADFRHQHQRLLAAGEAVGNRIEVDLGLAAAGDAIEQQSRETLRRAYRIGGGLLFGVEHERFFLPPRGGGCPQSLPRT